MPLPTTAASQHSLPSPPPAPPPTVSPPPPPFQKNTRNRDSNYSNQPSQIHDELTGPYYSLPTHLTVTPAEPNSSTVIPTSTFSVASLPRTSSLFPPAQRHQDIVPNSTTDPELDPFFLNASPASSFVTTAVRDSDVRHPYGLSLNHSRSSSLGGHSEGFRNLNRWSTSTASSFTSNFNNFSNTNTLHSAGNSQILRHSQAGGDSNNRSPGRRRSGFMRRMSIDSAHFAHSQPHEKSNHSSPRNRLHKSRPSTANDSPSRNLPASSFSKPRIPSSKSSYSATPGVTSSVNTSTVQNKSALLASTIAIENRSYFRDEKVDHDTISLSGTGRTESVSESALLPAVDISNRIENSRGDKMSDYREVKGRGDSQQRSSTTKNSGDRGASKNKSKHQPSQKAMLSRALQRANLAVQLDNQQSFEGARESYAEACEILQQVLQRTNGEEDKKKLDAIRQTYRSRILELDQMLPVNDKALPAQPDSGLDRIKIESSSVADSDGVAVIEPATATKIVRDDSLVDVYASANRAVSRRGSEQQTDPASLTQHYTLQSSFARSPIKGEGKSSSGSRNIIQDSNDSTVTSQPLSPTRTLSSTKPSSPEPPIRSDFSAPGSRLAPEFVMRGHVRTTSHESISWLDPIDESGGSAPSSVHSRSSTGMRRKSIHEVSGDTEAEFDAELDAVVEAAYDDGYDFMDMVELHFDEDDQVISNALRKVELARERVRESEREAAEMSQGRVKQFDNGIEESVFYDGNDSEDEERILDEITQRANHDIISGEDEFSFGSRNSPFLPRESDSSINTLRTWHTSMGSNPPSSLSIVTEISPTSHFNKSLPPPPPPSAGLPIIPPAAQPCSEDEQILSQPERGEEDGYVQQEQSRPPTRNQQQSHLQHSKKSSSSSLQNRRYSGQTSKQLKIETQHLPENTTAYQDQSVTATISYGNSSWTVSQEEPKTASRAQPPISKTPALSVPEEATQTSALLEEIPSRTASPSVSRPSLRKNISSSSLRSLKSRNLSVSHLDDASDVSPSTPSANYYTGRTPAALTMPIPLSAAFRSATQGSVTVGPQLFEPINSPSDPTSPNPLMPDAPLPLEPCPNDPMLRPFWLMRCLYQTLCHPRGGYLTNKIFVPRDVWKVKGVKLRNIEDKVAQCDHLTAALEKLARVDTCDADAVLEEMQAMESVFEQVQSALTRRLGNEVGLATAAQMFREAAQQENDLGGLPRSASVSAKSSSFSWRRLRSKNSGMGLNSSTAYTPKPVSAGDGVKDNHTIPSLPMTANPTKRPAKRDVQSIHFTGPYATYMSSLARLFDAAQTIDQIARQVDDPGLRHADKTQVGLELCSRQAAEVFAFYICRFVLTDLGMLMDKFIKRGTEWVLT